MMLPLHVFIALLSIALSGITFIRPTKRRLTTSYILVGGTLTSGTILVLQAPTHLGTACMSGLIYLAVVSTMLVAARSKTAQQT